MTINRTSAEKVAKRAVARYYTFEGTHSVFHKCHPPFEPVILFMNEHIKALT
jgi:hypothetical protein